MASLEEVVTEDAQATLKSLIWQQFDFPGRTINGSRATETTQVLKVVRMPKEAESISITTEGWMCRGM